MNYSTRNFCLFTFAFCLCIGTADAATRVTNTSRAMWHAQNQALQQQALDALNPVAVAPTVEVADGTTVVQTDLDKCSAIYPGGEFAYARPTAGVGVGGSVKCTAVVELRAIKGTDDVILARANVAAGDGIDCNIENFPAATYLPDAGAVIFPADKEPTVDDVIRVMNDEQKKNAGFKIAAGTIISAVAGNLLTKKDPVTGRRDASGAIIGALSGGAIMTASSYSGKVAGDMILSAGVNGAAGGIVGNIMAGNDSVLMITDCPGTMAGRCLWGTLEKSEKLNSDETAYYDIPGNRTLLCKNDRDCKITRLLVSDVAGYKSVDEAMAEDWRKAEEKGDFYTYSPEKNTMTVGDGDSNGRWVKINSGAHPGERVAAIIPNVGSLHKTFGAKMSDWYKWRVQNPNAEIMGRRTNGEPFDLGDDAHWAITDFYPLMENGADGGIIDVNNRARLDETLIGVGSGAGLGAFSSYMGAQDEIDARWVSAVTEYKDSLQKFYCATGTRFLTWYNDSAVIPNMAE